MQEPNQAVSFSHYLEGDDDNTNVSVQRTIEGPRGEILTTLLREFGLFLQQVGFTYVTEIVAVCDNGIEHSSDEI